MAWVRTNRISDKIMIFVELITKRPEPATEKNDEKEKYNAEKVTKNVRVVSGWELEIDNENKEVFINHAKRKIFVPRKYRAAFELDGKMVFLVDGVISLNIIPKTVPTRIRFDYPEIVAYIHDDVKDETETICYDWAYIKKEHEYVIHTRIMWFREPISDEEEKQLFKGAVESQLGGLMFLDHYKFFDYAPYEFYAKEISALLIKDGERQVLITEEDPEYKEFIKKLISKKMEEKT